MAVPRIEAFQDPGAQSRAQMVGEGIRRFGRNMGDAASSYIKARERTKTKNGAIEEFVDVMAEYEMFLYEKNPTEAPVKETESTQREEFPVEQGEFQKTEDFKKERGAAFKRIRDKESAQAEESRVSANETPNVEGGVPFNAELKEKYKEKVRKKFMSQLKDKNVTPEKIREYLYGIGKAQMAAKEGRKEFAYFYTIAPAVSLQKFARENWDSYEKNLSKFRTQKFMPMVESIVRDEMALAEKNKTKLSQEAITQKLLRNKDLGFSALQEDKIRSAVGTVLKGFQTQAQISAQDVAKTRADTANIKARTAGRKQTQDEKTKQKKLAMKKGEDRLKLWTQYDKAARSLMSQKSKVGDNVEDRDTVIAEYDSDILKNQVLAEVFAYSGLEDKEVKSAAPKLANSLAAINTADDLRAWKRENAVMLDDLEKNQAPLLFLKNLEESLKTEFAKASLTEPQEFDLGDGLVGDVRINVTQKQDDDILFDDPEERKVITTIPAKLTREQLQTAVQRTRDAIEGTPFTPEFEGAKRKEEIVFKLVDENQNPVGTKTLAEMEAIIGKEPPAPAKEPAFTPEATPQSDGNLSVGKTPEEKRAWAEQIVALNQKDPEAQIVVIKPNGQEAPGKVKQFLKSANTILAQ